MRYTRRHSQRAIQNHLTFLGGGTDIKQARKRGKQKESLVNDAGKAWAKLKGGELRRNRQGLVEIRSGVKVPMGLGTGTLDLVGPIPMRITPAMVGRTIAVYAELEAKTDEGVVAPHQQERVERLRDLGAISGVFRNVADCEVILAKWSTRRV